MAISDIDYNNMIYFKLMGQFFQCVIIIIYIMIAATSLGFARQANTQKNISMGNFILSKYLNNFKRYIHGLVFVWMFFLSFTFYEMRQYQKILLSHQQGDKENQSNEKVSLEEVKQLTLALQILQVIIYLQLSQGIILGILRASEPVYRNILLKEIRSWFGFPTLKVDEEDTVQMAASFGQMNQEISIDMIHAILYSITKYTVGEPKSEYQKEVYDDAEKASRRNEFYLSDYKDMYHAYDFKNKNITPIDYIMMEKEKQDEEVEEDDKKYVKPKELMDRLSQEILESKKRFMSIQKRKRENNNIINYMQMKKKVEQ